MSYLFERYSTVLEYRLALQDVSPYMECTDTAGTVRKINGLFRFGTMFTRIVKRMQQEGIEEASCRAPINVLFHLLANLDLISGLTQMDINMLLREEEILSERYGQQAKELYQGLSSDQKYCCLRYMQLRRQSGIRKSYAYEAMQKLLDAVFYYSEQKEKLYIWIPHEKEAQSAPAGLSCGQLYRLLACLFLDYWMPVQAVWGKPFGVIGSRQSIRIGEFQILEDKAED